MKDQEKRMTQLRRNRASQEAGRKPRDNGTQQAHRGVF